MKRLQILVGIVGCGSPSSPHLGTPDGQGADALGTDVSTIPLTVCGQPVVTAPPEIAIDGDVWTYDASVGGAIVEAWRDGESAPIATAVISITNSGNSVYHIVVPTNGVPFEGYLRLSVAPEAYFDSYWFTPPLVADTVAYQRLAFIHHNDQYFANGVSDPSRGVVLLGHEDCTGHGVSSASVTVTPPAYVWNFHDGTTAPIEDALFDAPPGPTKIELAAPGFVFPPRTIDVRANMMAYLEILPL